MVINAQDNALTYMRFGKGIETALRFFQDYQDAGKD